MNILFSCDEYPPAKTGGIGSATKTVAENLARRGHNIYVVSGRLDRSLPEIAVINGVTVYRLYLMQKLTWLFTDNFIAIKLHNLALRCGVLSHYAIKEYQRKQDFIEQIIKEKQINVVDLPDYTVLSKYYSAIKELPFRKFSIPSVGHIHGSMSFLHYYRNGRINPVMKTNDKHFFESVDKILSVSKFAADFVNKQLKVSTKCDVIYNPLVSSFTNIINAPHIMRKNTIVFLGKIIKTKGAFNLIKAFNIFVKRHPEYKLIMIGGGNIDKGKSLVEKQIKDKVCFTGYLSPDNIAVHLKTAAFCVIPTFFENFSVAALEVMGCENILIYTTTSSGPEVIEDGVDGFLVNPHDVGAIADKMIYVADNLNELKNIRVAAAQKIKYNFSEASIMDKLENYYKETILNA